MNTTKSKGFTIIEVVLVLAIAALIFLIVFLAVPALQRSQRDTQRRTDAGRLLTYLSNYQSNNRGALPDTGAKQTAFKTNYAKELTSPTTGNPYVLNFTATPSGDFSTMIIALGSKCDGDSGFVSAASRNVAVRVALESGGGYCTEQ